jgi:hypothetical protein
MLQVSFFWCCPLNASASTTSLLRGQNSKCECLWCLYILQPTGGIFGNLFFSPAFNYSENACSGNSLYVGHYCAHSHCVLCPQMTDESGSRKLSIHIYRMPFVLDLLAQLADNTECSTVISVMPLKCTSCLMMASSFSDTYTSWNFEVRLCNTSQIWDKML